VLLLLLFLSLVKLTCEIALMALLGQGVLFALAGDKRDSNFFYQLLTVLTKPFTKVARLLTPAAVADKHVPVVAFFILLIIWAVATLEKVQHCLSVNMVGCR
jgi:hypothetical protein